MVDLLEESETLSHLTSSDLKSQSGSQRIEQDIFALFFEQGDPDRDEIIRYAQYISHQLKRRKVSNGEILKSLMWGLDRLYEIRFKIPQKKKRQYYSPEEEQLSEKKETNITNHRHLKKNDYHQEQEKENSVNQKIRRKEIEEKEERRKQRQYKDNHFYQKTQKRQKSYEEEQQYKRTQEKQRKNVKEKSFQKIGKITQDQERERQRLLLVAEEKKGSTFIKRESNQETDTIHKLVRKLKTLTNEQNQRRYETERQLSIIEHQEKMVKMKKQVEDLTYDVEWETHVKQFKIEDRKITKRSNDNFLKICSLDPFCANKVYRIKLRVLQQGQIGLGLTPERYKSHSFLDNRRMNIVRWSSFINRKGLICRNQVNLMEGYSNGLQNGDELEMIIDMKNMNVSYKGTRMNQKFDVKIKCYQNERLYLFLDMKYPGTCVEFL